MLNKDNSSEEKIFNEEKKYKFIIINDIKIYKII